MKIAHKHSHIRARYFERRQRQPGRHPEPGRNLGCVARSHSTYTWWKGTGRRFGSKDSRSPLRMRVRKGTITDTSKALWYMITRWTIMSKTTVLFNTPLIVNSHEMRFCKPAVVMHADTYSVNKALVAASVELHPHAQGIRWLPSCCVCQYWWCPRKSQQRTPPATPVAGWRQCASFCVRSPAARHESPGGLGLVRSATGSGAATECPRRLLNGSIGLYYTDGVAQLLLAQQFQKTDFIAFFIIKINKNDIWKK